MKKPEFIRIYSMGGRDWAVWRVSDYIYIGHSCPKFNQELSTNSMYHDRDGGRCPFCNEDVPDIIWLQAHLGVMS